MSQTAKQMQLLILAAAMAALCSGCRPSGPAEFKKSATAFQKISRMRVEWTAETDRGTFKQSAELDCVAPYYHRLSVKDLTEKGIAEGTRSALGAPKAHQETEMLYLDGASYLRTSGVWASDAATEWSVSNTSNYNPRSECEAIRQGKNPEDGPFAEDVHFLPVFNFAGALVTNQMNYVSETVVPDGGCREFTVTYEDSVESARTVTSNGEYVSYSPKPVKATVCLGKDDALPRQIVQGPWTVNFFYGDFVPLPAPPVSTAENR